MSKISNTFACMFVSTFVVIFSVGLPFFFIMALSEKDDTGGVFQVVSAAVLWSFICFFISTFISTTYGIAGYKMLKKAGLLNYITIGVGGSLPGLWLYLYHPSNFSFISIVWGILIAIVFLRMKNSGHFT